MFELDIFKDILKLNIGISQPDNQIMFDALNTIYPINIHRHETGREHNGWIIPHQWNVKKRTN